MGSIGDVNALGKFGAGWPTMDARSGDEELGACECEYVLERDTDERDLVDVGDVVTRLCPPPWLVRESRSEFSGVVSDGLTVSDGLARL
jgi:hypothetical protein